MASAPRRLDQARELGRLGAGGSAKLVGGGAPSWPQVARGQLESAELATAGGEGLVREPPVCWFSPSPPLRPGKGAADAAPGGWP